MPCTDDPSPTSRGAVAALVMALTANALGHAFLLITVPPLARAMGWSDLQAGLLLGASALVLSLCGPVWGGICDRWGRRRVLLLTVTAAVLFPALFAVIVGARLDGRLPPDMAFGLALVLRLAHVLVIAGLMPAAQAFLADTTPGHARARGMGVMGAAFGVGSVAGGALAWQVGVTHVEAALFGIAAVALLAWGALWALLTEPAAPRVASVIGPSARPGALLGRVWPYLAVTACGLTVYGVIHQVTALRLQDAFGFSVDAALRRSGVMMMLTLAAMVVVQGLVVRWLAWTPGRLLRVGSGVAFCAMALATLAPTVAVLMAATVALGCGLGLVLPGNLAALSLEAGPGVQARAAGLNGVAQGLGMAAGAVAGAALHQLSPTAPYAVSVALLMLLTLLAVRHGAVAFAR